MEDIARILDGSSIKTNVFQMDSAESSSALDDFLHMHQNAGIVSGALESRKINVPEIVRNIVADVRSKGDEALIEYEKKLDAADVSGGRIGVTEAELKAAHQNADAEYLGIIRRAKENIEAYQKHIKLKNPEDLEIQGKTLGLRYTPVDRVGVYVPGGRAFYPSTVLMTVVPALVAGVDQIAMACPPTGGEISNLALAIAWELGITEVYRLGGAVAIAALACGTGSVQAVDKIVGPGNAFVAEAKRQLFGTVGIDSIAGPSEVLLLCDETADPEFVAADLLAQAEHNPGSGILITNSLELLEKTVAALQEQVAELDRKDATLYALEHYSALVFVPNIDAGVELVNRFAPEHFQLIVKYEEEIVPRIRHCGAMFVGPYSAVPLGDYIAGPSHVLPTNLSARFFSGLSCNEFLKSSSYIKYSKEAVENEGEQAALFAEREGLGAHSTAIRMRLGK